MTNLVAGEFDNSPQIVTEVLHGDCCEVIRDYLKAGWADAFQLVFADPPFNIGEPYDGVSDSLPAWEFSQFTREWISLASDCVASGGRIAINVPDSMIWTVLDTFNGRIAAAYSPADLRGYWRRDAWIIWHYRFGQCKRSNWINSKTHCLVYTYGENQVWNPDSVLVESDRSAKYNDPRIDETVNGGFRVPFDVWGIPSDGPNWGRVTDNSRERVADHPNQLPEVYLERLIRAYTNPGDNILDPFGGTGTTSVVARALGRNSWTIEQSENYCDDICRRIERGAVRI